MGEARLKNIVSRKDNLIIEGAMGLFDGAPPNANGSTAHLAKLLNFPIVLIIDSSRTGQSIAALAKGFLTYDEDLLIKGIILNNVGSANHENILRHSLSQLDCPIIGSVYRNPELSLPSRHLGLVQAAENQNLNQFFFAVLYDLIFQAIQ